MDNTHAVLIQELEKYASKAFNGYSYLTSDSDGTHFVITSVGHIRGRGVVNTAIIIHRDIFDKPLRMRWRRLVCPARK